MHRIRPHLSYANVVSSVCLFILLGGTSFALASGSIGSREIKDNTIRSKDVRHNALRSSDIRNRSLLARDFKAGQLPAGARGQRGPQGIQGTKGLRGATGASGSAAAYAKVDLTIVAGEPTYTVVPDQSQNVAGVSRTGSGAIPAIPGIVCVDVSVPVDVAVANADRLPVEPAVITSVQLPTLNGADRCPPGSDALIRLKDSSDAATESGFFVIFN